MSPDADLQEIMSNDPARVFSRDVNASFSSIGMAVEGRGVTREVLTRRCYRYLMLSSS